MSANLFSALVDRAAADHGEAVYLCTPASPEGTVITFSEFRRTARDWAAGMRARGVHRGSRVAILTDNRPEFVVAWYACQFLGATIASINPELPADTQAHLVDLIKPTLCVRSAPDGFAPAAVAALESALIPIVDVAYIADRSVVGLFGANGEGFQAEPLPQGHPSQIIFTSGTSGRPKAAIQTADLMGSQLDIARRVGLRETDRLMIVSPLFHGLAQSWFQYGMALGITVVVAPRLSISRFWDDCRRLGVTATQHVGAIVSFLMHQPETDRDRDNPVRLTFGVGAPTAMWSAFEERFGVEIVEFYGMTEVGLLAFNDRPTRIGSVGRRAGALDVRLVDEGGVDVSVGEVGEAWSRPIGSSGKRPEYFGDPAATAAAEHDGWFMTGDLLREDEEGYLYFVGRKKESLRRRGENIVPEDIERAILALDEVVDCAAVGVPSTHGDDDIKLCVVLSDDGRTIAIGELATRLTDVLPRMMQPRYVTTLDALPYTPTNKLQRSKLKTEPALVWDIESSAWVELLPNTQRPTGLAGASA